LLRESHRIRRNVDTEFIRDLLPSKIFLEEVDRILRPRATMHFQVLDTSILGRL